MIGILDAPGEAEVGIKAMAASPGPVEDMSVEGDMFSNSPVEVDAGASITLQNGAGMIARGGCTGTVNPCTSYTFTQDPTEGVDDALLPSVTSPAGLINRDASVPAACPGAAPNVVIDGRATNVAFMGNHTRITVQTDAGILVALRFHGESDEQAVEEEMLDRDVHVWWDPRESTVVTAGDPHGSDVETGGGPEG